jgi:eukaryotic-like serine/threonine-protein kinase
MSETPPDSASQFLTLAVQHRLLSPADAERISQLVTQRAALPQHVALEEGLLDAVEVDIVDTLTNQTEAIPGYEVLGLLGRGGMGVVFRARQLNLDREVALKTLLLSQITQREALCRFEQEARTIGKLQHPHIVTAYDFGKHRGRFF